MARQLAPSHFLDCPDSNLGDRSSRCQVAPCPHKEEWTCVASHSNDHCHRAVLQSSMLMACQNLSTKYNQDWGGHHGSQATSCLGWSASGPLMTWPIPGQWGISDWFGSCWVAWFVKVQIYIWQSAPKFWCAPKHNAQLEFLASTKRAREDALGKRADVLVVSMHYPTLWTSKNLAKNYNFM